MKKKQITIDIKEIKNSCFVVMPFNPLFKTEYEDIIQPAITELGLECVRGDEIYSQQRIMDDIWESIKSCRLVIAELTTRNPNVLYEIGLAHAIGKPVIIITRNADDVPFDLKDLRYLFYDTNNPFWGENLKEGIKSLISKVLESPEIGIYLEGISKVAQTDFPKLQKVQKEDEDNEKAKFNLSGIWKTEFYNDDKSLRHELILTLAQDKVKLSGTAIITYIDNGILTVVQEIFHGTVIDSKVNLVGGNYSYIERGNTSNYILDNFDMTIVNEVKMLGIHDDGSIKQDAIFSKIEQV
jgi:hypothetical protein